MHSSHLPSPRRLRICLINPRFHPSIWTRDEVLAILPGGKRSWIVTGSLPALASLAPEHCDVVLVDENVEDIDFEHLGDFDIVGVTGMIVQRDRMFEILDRLRDLPVTAVVGGPYVSVSEPEFVDRCDVRFIGEAEETWPRFLTAFALGESVHRRYEQDAKTNMETVPTPRYDLLKSGRYMVASLQFSRGCPFLCEFCDIITIFGRRPRLKLPAQMILECEAIVKAGFSTCFLVDDNFIGNKAKAKELLRVLIDWQQANNYPLVFSTEASINLADDEEMLDLMRLANFRQVFVGIESPRASSLAETRKVQNVRGDSMIEKLQRIRGAGLVIQAGFIVGFDADDEAIFDEQFAFIQQSGIAPVTVSILCPIPTTPLYDRLRTEGRLDLSDPHVSFHPKNMTREVLKAGYDKLVRRLYEPDAYFDRLVDGYAGSPGFRRSRAAQAMLVGRERSGMGRLAELAAAALTATRLLGTLIAKRQAISLGSAYVRHWRRNRRLCGREAIPFGSFVFLCIEHWHCYVISQTSIWFQIGSSRPETMRPLPANEDLYLPKIADGRKAS
ncbi:MULTISPECIES: radical SAM protein [unclassified Mesorhizobium]|uniref:radical SAM protein n=1 Tax=unclassified Mesorhizobium TaxID=325217 RepID=UPI000BB01479|nr:MULTISPECIES: radical SAM protein [unclassified Mesorhizobium]PBB28001.1 B12-binding domain-containing radical SAM protein [Mesorhizobium sp. WSM4304]PBB75468.1 B12-binding domain-containing radical SAM protein [Mesorhizobium sp. WSM4308]